MTSEPAAASKSNGLSVLWDVIVAPRAAFAAIRERPTAGWAFIVATALFAIGAILLIPVNEHLASIVMADQIAHNPQVAALTPEQQKTQLAIATGIQRWVWVMSPLVIAIAASVTALVMLIANAIGRGDGNFRRLFALATNVSVISFGIGYVALAALAAFRGPDSFATTRDLSTAIPSLAWLLPADASPKLAVFLGTLHPFALWSIVLLALGMQDVARINRVTAWVAAFVVVAGSAAFAAAFAK